MRIRMQLKPHPSQFLSLREMWRGVNAGVPAAPNKNKRKCKSQSKSNRRSFDYASRDEAARGSAQDDSSERNMGFQPRSG